MKRLIYSCVMLALSGIMCITVVVAWFTKNTEVSANNIVASGVSITCDLDLEYWDGTDWIDITSDQPFCPYLEPEDILYYRLHANPSASSSVSITATFSDVASSLNSEYLGYNSTTSKIVYDSTTPLYDVQSNAVTITAGETTKTLYKITTVDGETEIELADFKIDEVINFYSIATNNNESYSSFETDLAAGKTSGDIVAKDLTDADLFTISSMTNGTDYYSYFALEFPESSESNYYQFQTLSIGFIRIYFS